MKVPRIGLLGNFVTPKTNKTLNKTIYNPAMTSQMTPLNKDTVTFTSSTAHYLKKYLTLPDEIKMVLTPEDAIDMFKDMEWLAQGKVKRNMIGEGKGSEVYKNPWLSDYYLLILKDVGDNDTITVYSGEKIGDAIWQDKDNNSIQILKKAS